MSADLRFPIGKLAPFTPIDSAERNRLIDEIAVMPVLFRAAVAGLSADQLDTPYREGGWTARQVIHHVPDSHMNAYVRFKLALTETDPAIKPYAEDKWAELHDTAETPVEVSLALLDQLHARWTILLRGMSEVDWKRNYVHPQMGPVPLEHALQVYAWHGKHHTAHVTYVSSSGSSASFARMSSSVLE
jgi:uncharacterized damage-inducible protein DinB